MNLGVEEYEYSDDEWGENTEIVVPTSSEDEESDILVEDGETDSSDDLDEGSAQEAHRGHRFECGQWSGDVYLEESHPYETTYGNEDNGGTWEDDDMDGQYSWDQENGEMENPLWENDDVSDDMETTDPWREEEEENMGGGIDGSAPNEGPLDNDLDVEDLVGISAERMYDLQFLTIPKVVGFYEKYAMAKGFSIRNGHKRYDEKGLCIWGDIYCSREGKRDKKWLENPRPKKTKQRETRCSCPAKCCFKYDKVTRVYRISKIVMDHNHPLALQMEAHMLRSTRRVSEGDIDTAMAMRDCNIGISQAYDMMCFNKGGYKYVGFLDKDLYNATEARTRLNMIGGDVDIVMKFMHDKGIEDKGHRCIFSLIEGGRMGNIIWRDSTSLNDYGRFHDTLLFDSTYKTNIYGRPLVLFVGANHHRQTILFAAAILVDEKTETYVWALKEFLRLMRGVAPESVLTDGDVAMHNAVVIVFPNATHRLCSWHLARNVGQHIKDKTIRDKFLTLVFQPMSFDSFESKFDGVVGDLEQAGANEVVMNWVETMYRKKELWAAAFFYGKFFGMMTSTQRVEGLHRHFKTGLRRISRLHQIPYRIAANLAKMRQKVLKADYGSANSTPVQGTSMLKVQEKLARRLTSVMYNVAVNQIGKITKYNVRDYGDNEEREYKLWTVNQSYREGVEWQVEFAEGRFRCSCGLFECDGVPCAHIYTCMKNNNMEDLPDTMINPRWTTANRAAAVAAERLNEVGIVGNTYVRAYALNAIATSICSSAAVSVEGYMVALKELTKLNSGLKKLKLNIIDLPVQIDNDTTESVILDPQPPGRQNVRTRKCTYCKETGHNTTSCSIRLRDEAERVFPVNPNGRPNRRNYSHAGQQQTP